MGNLLINLPILRYDSPLQNKNHMGKFLFLFIYFYLFIYFFFSPFLID